MPFRINNDLRILKNDRPTETNLFWRIHGIIFCIAWGLFGFIILITGRYFRSYWKTNIYIHIIFGSIILLGTLIAGFMAF